MDENLPHRVTVVTDAAEWVLKYRLYGDASKHFDLLDMGLRGDAGDDGAIFLTDDAGTRLSVRTQNIDSVILESDDG